jgi:PAS domain S-box-containing protein
LGANEPLEVKEKMKDLAECRRAETILPAEELFQSVANALPMMISCSGPDGHAVFFNKSWLSFRGRSVDQERGFSWTEGVHPEDRPRVLTAIASSLETRKEYYVEYRLRRADGEYRSLLCSGVPRSTPDGIFVGYIATCTDISDYKRTQEEAAAHQKPERIDLLARGISRHFDNLLAAILDSAENALAAHAGGMSIEEELQKIRVASIRAAELVQKLEHGAAMSVVRTPGRATTFQAWFPAGEKLENKTTSMATGEKPLGSGTILVVEDEELLRIALVKGLKRRGFSVVEASDAAGALTLIRSDSRWIDSILLEMVLPGKISSRAVFEEAQRIKPGVKVILTSAYSEETATAAFGGLRVEHFLRKPFHFADIVERLDNGPAR